MSSPGPSDSSDPAVVLVTGATGPLGSVAIERFARDGARIAAVGRDRAALDAVAERVGLAPDRWLPVVGELTDVDAGVAIANAVTERWGRIDVLLHLVGGWAGGTDVVDLDADEIRRMLDQHLWTTLNVVQAVVPGMVGRRFGRVLVVSSPFAAEPAGGGGSYSVAKAAQEALIRSLARELGNSGVTANVLIVRTIDAKHERETAPSSKNARWTTPEEIADVLAFLASPAAATVNGVRFPLDGR